MGRHIDALERRIDGHIDPALRQEARALDDAEAELLRHFPVAPAQAPRRPSKAARIARMARVMIERHTAAGACLDTDLAGAGFTAAEIACFADGARSIAAYRLGDLA